MIKKILLVIAFILIAGYLLFSISFFDGEPKDDACDEFEIVVSNANGNQFINVDEIKKLIKQNGLDPTNKLMKDINTIEIESLLLKNKHVKKADVYITNKNGIRVTLEERKPLIRIIPDAGESYYIDSEGKKMQLSKRYTAYLPIATGNIKEAFAEEELYKFALFLQDNSFWNAQVEQIIVKPNNDIEFIPRVGEHTIVLGSLDGLDKKLDKLMTFYEDGLNRIGWNKYSVINLKYNKQVVCTK